VQKQHSGEVNIAAFTLHMFVDHWMYSISKVFLG
jgi:hypothetical protein